MLEHLVNSLNGKIWLIPGNHDHPSRLSKHGIKVMSSIDKTETRFYLGNLIFSHQPLEDEEIPFDFINVFGHIHNKNAYGKRINVCVDVTDFKPVSLEEIKQKARKITNGSTL